MMHLYVALGVALAAALIFYPKHVGLAWARLWGFLSELFEGAGEAFADWREARRAAAEPAYFMAGLGGPAPTEATATPRPPGMNPLRVIVGLVGLIWRHKRIVLLLIIALVAWRVMAPVVSFVTCPFGGAVYCFDNARRETNAEVREARSNEMAAEHERDVAVFGAERAERTRQVERHVEQAVEDGQQDIANAVSHDDFDALHAAYARAYERVWDDVSPGDGDSAPPGFDAVPAPGGHRA